MASAAAVAWIGVTGCGSHQPRQADQGLRPAYDTVTGRLRSLAYDADRDRHFEWVAYFDGRRLSRVDVDENGDGRLERREFYEAGPVQDHGSEPVLAAVEAFDPSGRVVARREGYRHGALAWAQEDRNLDGQPDRWETWTSGALRRVVIAAPGGRGRALRITYPDPIMESAYDRAAVAVE
jgi:hypothetical protein